MEVPSAIPTGADAIGATACVRCIRCATAVPASRRRCQRCGFSIDEMRRWRLRNREVHRHISIQLSRRVRVVVAFALWRFGWSVGIVMYGMAVPFDTAVRAAPALLAFRDRVSAVLALIIAASVDLMLRKLPGWNGPTNPGDGRLGRIHGRWLPGALALAALEPAVGALYVPRIRPEWAKVSIKLALAMLAVAAAASLAVTAWRMDWWRAELRGAVSSAPTAVGRSVGWRFARVWGGWVALTAAFILFDGLLPYKRQAHPNASIEMGLVLRWPILAAQIVWLWNLLAVQRSLRRWVHD